MQLDIFAAAPQPVDLRKTKLPELAEAFAQVGSPQQWATYTLGQVRALWEQLYDTFVGVLDGPIHDAKCFCQEHKQQEGMGGPVARKFYQREYERLVQGQQQLRATVENRYCDNLLAIFSLGKQALVASGLSEEEAEDAQEFFNEVVQHPQSADLVKPLPTLMQELAQEYLRLN